MNTGHQRSPGRSDARAEAPVRLTWLAAVASWAHSAPALPMLHAAARNVPGVTWSAVRATIHDDPAETAYRIWQQRPDLLTGTVYLFNRRFVLDVCARVKAMLPECTVVLGGPEWLGNNEATLRAAPFLDAVIRGEGECILADFLAAVRDGRPWQDIPGVCSLTAAGGYVDNGCAPPANDFASLPPPTDSPFFEWDKPFVSIETARGCPFACSFCTSAVVGRPLRTLPFERVQAMLDRCAERGVREVRVLDRTFNAPPDRARNLLAMMRSRFPDIRFHLEWHPDILPDYLREELARWPPGRLHLEVGIQTTAPDVLRMLNRSADAAAALQNLRFLCGLPNLTVHADLMTGLPGQTLDQVFRDLDALAAAGAHEIQIEVLKVLPGTPLSASASDLGIAYAPAPPWEVLQTPDMSPDDLATARRLSRVVDAFYNAPELRTSTRTAWSEQPGFFRRFTAGIEHVLTFPASLERRFRTFHQYARRHDLPRTAETLEVAWLRCGFSPRHGIARAQPWRGPVPDDLVFDESPPPGQTRGTPRVWRVHGRFAEYWVLSYGPGRIHIGRRASPER